MPSLLPSRRPSRRRAVPARRRAGGRRRPSGTLPSCNKNRQPRCLRNQQFSVTALTDDTGAVVERYSYTAYGVLGIHAPDGTARSATAHTNRYTYTGREWSPEIGLYYYRARWYDAELGRFVSRDPIGYTDSTYSLYAYARCSPVDRVDYLGTWSVKIGSIDFMDPNRIDFDLVIDYHLPVGDEPRGATQVWIYNSVTFHVIDEDCNARTIDTQLEIINIHDGNDLPVVGGNYVINDNHFIAKLGPSGFCLVTTVSESTIGFNAPGMRLPVGTNQPVDNRTGEILLQMRGPIGRFVTYHTHVNPISARNAIVCCGSSLTNQER